MDNYIEELKKQVHEQASKIMEIAGVTKELLNVDPKTSAAWVAELKDKGVIVGNKPYHVQQTPKGDGVNPNREEALTGLLEATVIVLRNENGQEISEAYAKAHSLYVFGRRIIEVAHGINDGQSQGTWEANLTGAMKGELQAGIGGQASGLAQGAVMSGMGAMWELHTETRGEERMAELEEKMKAGILLSREESDERGVLQGAEYGRLDQADKKGIFGLSKEKKAKLEKYKNDDAAARAALAPAAEYVSPYSGKAAAEINRNLLKKAFEKFEAENPNIVRDELAKEAERLQQLEAALYAADEPRRKPEPQPGTLAAVASAKAPTYVDPKGMDSMRAVAALPRAQAPNSDAHMKQALKHPGASTTPPAKTVGVLDVLIPTVFGSVGVAPMPGVNPALSGVGIVALGNPLTAGVAGIAGMLGMDYQTQRHEVEMAYEGWRKGDASLLPDMIWSQPAAQEMMEREMGYPFGRPDLAPPPVTKLESPLPNRLPQACGGIEIPIQGKAQPISIPTPLPSKGESLVTPMPEETRPEPISTPVPDPSPGLTEGFDIHRPSPEGLVMYKKEGGNGYEQPKVYPAPKDGLPAFPEARRAQPKTPMQNGKLRNRWKDKEHIYEWDAQHGKVEKYDRRGKHQGEFDHNTGHQTKPANPTRRIEP